MKRIICLLALALVMGCGDDAITMPQAILGPTIQTLTVVWEGESLCADLRIVGVVGFSDGTESEVIIEEFGVVVPFERDFVLPDAANSFSWSVHNLNDIMGTIPKNTIALPTPGPVVMEYVQPGCFL